MKQMTVYEMDKLGLATLEKELQNLQTQKDVLIYTYGESVKDTSEFKKVITDINLISSDIEKINLKELRSNVKGHVVETTLNDDSSFTIKVKSGDKIHIYKGIYVLDLVPSEQVDIGDSLGMIKEYVYYEVQDNDLNDGKVAGAALVNSGTFKCDYAKNGSLKDHLDKEFEEARKMINKRVDEIDNSKKYEINLTIRDGSTSASQFAKDIMDEIRKKQGVR